MTGERDRCTSCRRPAPHLVPAYWAPDTEHLCGPCCALVAARFDRTAWPVANLERGAAA